MFFQKFLLVLSSPSPTVEDKMLPISINIHTTLLGALYLANWCLGQNSTQYVGAHVPSGTSIVGSYGGQYRPQVHFSPPSHFMNDPNGMFRDHNGTWHLYYQYNPTKSVAGNQHWGHATSQDLYHWTNQPIALFPPKKNVYIFSGSAVIDKNNTSGFFGNQSNGVVAIYVSILGPFACELSRCILILS